MNDPDVMGIGNGLANLNENVQEAGEGKFVHDVGNFVAQIEQDLSKVPPFDFLHREEELALTIPT